MEMGGMEWNHWNIIQDGIAQSIGNRETQDRLNPRFE